MALAAAIMGCRMCGETRYVQVIVNRRHADADGEPLVDVEVSERDTSMVERFYKTHLRPFAMAVA